MNDLWEYLSLFVVTFLGGTFIPFSTEAYFAYMEIGRGTQFLPTVLSATLGNTLASVFNYFLGYYGGRALYHRWFGFKEEELKKAERIFRKWGSIALFFAFLPVVGDPLTAVAGFLRYPFLPFLLLVGGGKLLRYIVLYISLAYFK